MTPGYLVYICVAKLLIFIVMREINLDFLMSDWQNPAKGQLLAHAACNLCGIPWTPAMGAIDPFDISRKAQPLFSMAKVSHQVTGDLVTCGSDIVDAVTSLLSSGKLTKSDLEKEVSILVDSVYDGAAYVNSMGPW